MRYIGHKSINNVQIIPDGVYSAAIYNDNPNIAIILPDRTDGRIDNTTYINAGGNITYEIEFFYIRLKKNRIRRL